MNNFARGIYRGLSRRGPGPARKGAAVFLAFSLLLPGPAARAAEFEITADSFTVVNQVNLSSVTYFQARASAPPDPALATQLLTPGGLYFDATYYNVWDRTSLAWVKLATGTAEAGRVAKAGDFMSGQLTTASTITVQGSAFSVGASTFVVIGGKVGVGTTNPIAALHAVQGYADATPSAYFRKSAGTSAGKVLELKTDYNSGDGSILEASNADGTAVVIKNSGKVGIGTTSPATKLHVKSAAGEDAIMRVDSTDADGGSSSDARIELYEAGSRRYELYNDGGDADRLKIDANGANALTIQQDRRMGIGTEAPSARLHVSSAAASASDNVLLVSSGASAGQELWVVKGDGNVGVGTASPAARLDVNGGGIFKSTSGIGNVWFGYNDGTRDYGVYQWQTAGAAPANYFQNNIGIGTTGPGAKLDIKSSGVSTYPLRVLASDGGNMGYFFEDAGQHAIFDLFDGGGNNDVRLNTNGDSWLTGGNVGVGTASPAQKLDVSGGNIQATGASGSQASVYVNKPAASDAQALTFRTGGVDKWNLGVRANNSYLEFWDSPAGTSMFTILAGGNVGVGAAAPTAKLHVGGTPGVDGIRFPDGTLMTTAAGTSTGQSSATDLNLAADSDANGSGVMTLATAAQERVRVANNGNVGIGTTVPRAKLDVVSGNANTNGDAALEVEITGPNTNPAVMQANLAIQTNNAQGADIGGSIAFGGLYQAANDGANFAIIKGAKENGTNADTAGYLAFVTRGGTPEKMRITSTGNVGVGTTVPGEKFQVRSAPAAGAVQGSFRSDSGTNVSYGGISVGANGGKTGYLTVGDASYSPADYFAKADWLTMVGTAGVGLRFGANTRADDVVINTSGNVGVGTTSPQQSLHVAGSGLLVTGTASAATASSVALDWFSSGARLISRGADTLTRGTFDFNIQASNGSLGLLPISMQSDGDVVLAQSAGNVGVGTTSPSDALHVYRDYDSAGSRTSNAATLLVDGAPGKDAWLGWGVGGVTSFVAGFDNGEKQLDFWGHNDTSWNHTLAMTTTGQVGIGTRFPYSGASPAKLDVRGRLFVTDPGDIPAGMYISRSGGPTADWNSPGGTWGVYRYGSAQSDRFCIGVAGVNEPFCVLTGGNVGVGATSPGLKLEIQGTAAALPPTSGNTPTGFMRLGDGGGSALYMGGTSASPYVQWLQSLNRNDQSVNYPLALNPNGGNVGVGTTNPGYKLDVNGDLNLAAGGVYRIGGVAQSGSSKWTAGTGDNIYRTLGKVGVGTGDPTLGKLHAILGSVNGPLALQAEAAGVGTDLQWFDNDDVSYKWDLSYRGSLAGDNLHLYRNPGSPDLATTWTIGGRVGVGAGENPAARLHVSSANAVAADTILQVSSGTSAGQELLVVKGDGKVGIGTTGPDHALDVRGNIFMGAPEFGSFTTIADTIYLGHTRKFLSNATGVAVDGSTDWMNLLAHPGSKGIILGTSGSADATPHDAINPRMVIQAGGSVGVGTAAPGTGFGSASWGTLGSGPGNYFSTHLYGNKDGGALLLEANDSVHLMFADRNSAANQKVSRILSQGGKLTFQGLNDALDVNGQPVAANDNVLVVDYAAGNVGIGVAAPGAKLDVAGQIQFRSPAMTSSEDLFLKSAAAAAALNSGTTGWGGGGVYAFWNDAAGQSCTTKCTNAGKTCGAALAVHQSYVSLPSCSYSATAGIACLCY